MFGAILAGAGISAVGGLLGAKGAKDAANIQAEAAREATAEQRRQYDISRSDFGRWREAGSESVGRLRTLLGLSGAPATEGYGSLNRRFTMDDFEADPVNQLGLQFGLDEGSKAIRRMFGAQGMGRSGAAAKGLTRFATDYAGSKAAESRSRFLQDQDITFNRLAGVSGLGQTATANTASLGAQTAANIGSNITGAGNARGAAAIAGANAYAAPFGQVGNTLSTKFLLDSMKPQTPSGTPWTMYGDD
jgi:hypothetical protein